MGHVSSDIREDEFPRMRLAWPEKQDEEPHAARQWTCDTLHSQGWAGKGVFVCGVDDRSPRAAFAI